MNLDISKQSYKALETYPHKHANQIYRKIISLQWNQFPQDYVHLSQNPGLYRVDSGEYRIIYKIFDRVQRSAKIIPDGMISLVTKPKGEHPRWISCTQSK